MDGNRKGRSTGLIYRLLIICNAPNQTRFLERIIMEFETLDPNDKLYLLRGFNLFFIDA